MTLSRVRNGALVLAVVSFVVGVVLSFSESGAAPRSSIGHHVTRTIRGLTFNIDTIISTLVAGTLVLLLGFVVRGTLTKETPTTTSRRRSSWCGRRSSTRSTPRSRTTSARCTRSSPRSRSALFFFILFCELARAAAAQDQRRVPHPVGPDRRHQPDLRAGALVTMVSVWVYGIRQKGLKGYFKHFVEPFPVLLPAQHARGADQADHAGPATLRQHLRRRHHARR